MNSKKGIPWQTIFNLAPAPLIAWMFIKIKTRLYGEFLPQKGEMARSKVPFM
jgi:hypothetical protein